MMTRVVLIGLLVVLSHAVPALADDPPDPRGPRVSGLFAATLGESQTNMTVAGAFGYRFTPYLALEFEVTAIPELDTLESDIRRLDALAAPAGVIFPTFVQAETSGRAVFFTSNFRGEIPTGKAWLIPYAVGGGGIANLRERFRLGPIPLATTLPSSFTTLVPNLGSFSFPERTIANNETDLVLHVGGGVEFHLVKGLWLDVDLRYYRVFAGRDLNLGRFGTGASYRF